MSFPDIFLSVDKFVGNAKLIGPDCSPRYGRSSGAVKVQLQSRSAKAAWYCHMRSRIGGVCGESRLQSEALFISINCYTSDDELGIVSMISPPETTRARWDCALALLLLPRLVLGPSRFCRGGPLPQVESGSMCNSQHQPSRLQP